MGCLACTSECFGIYGSLCGLHPLLKVLRTFLCFILSRIICISVMYIYSSVFICLYVVDVLIYLTYCIVDFTIKIPKLTLSRSLTDCFSQPIRGQLVEIS